MKEPIQQGGQEVSIVIYDSPLPPRYIRFSKKFIRTLFVVTPVVIGIVFVSLLVVLLTPQIKEVPSPGIPTILSQDDSRFSELENEVKSLKESNRLIQEKLTTKTNGNSIQEEPFLMGIKKPYGMQNLISENRVTLDQFEYVLSQNKSNLKFQIISTNPENRVSGHVIVFMISKSGAMAYPEEANRALNAGIKFSMGEPFAVSRLRPTNAEFSLRPVGDEIKFLIYIFSREGDLLLVKESETYKNGTK
jgi:hypothetical protein